MSTETWTPVYTPWRHGGWYVHNVRYPSGACGCVSRNYSDGKWRIVTENTGPGAEGDRTFATRDAAARAEHKRAEAQCAAVARADAEAEHKRAKAQCAAEAGTAELDPYRPAENWAECPTCGAELGWNNEDGLQGQTCGCGYQFSGTEDAPQEAANK
jgi:hypothetical protein